MAQLPKAGLIRGHKKPIHGSCAIYFSGGITYIHLNTWWWNGMLKVGGLIPFTRWRSGNKHDLLNPAYISHIWMGVFCVPKWRTNPNSKWLSEDCFAFACFFVVFELTFRYIFTQIHLFSHASTDFCGGCIHLHVHPHNTQLPHFLFQRLVDTPRKKNM